MDWIISTWILAGLLVICILFFYLYECKIKRLYKIIEDKSRMMDRLKAKLERKNEIIDRLSHECEQQGKDPHVFFVC